MEYIERKSVRNVGVIGGLSIVAFMGIVLALWGTAHAATGFGSVKVTGVVSGGTAHPDDFTLQIKKSGGTDTGLVSGSGDVVTFSLLTPGTYTLSESGGPSGYSVSWGGDCNAQGNVTIVSNGVATCIITNTFGVVVGSIKVMEVVSGGTGNPSDFNVHIKKSGAADTGSPSGSGSVILFSQLTPGAYTIIESGGPSGYNVSWSGACNAQGNITVVGNATATCIITHTFITTGGGGGDRGSGRDRPVLPPRPTR